MHPKLLIYHLINQNVNAKLLILIKKLLNMKGTLFHLHYGLMKCSKIIASKVGTICTGQN